ncbi:MAG: M28 family peptidase, partial [bacterium]|nr:M28 family peptidase [bacterium]
EHVDTESFAARGWDFSTCMVTGDRLGPIDALPIEFSASTPAGGISAELVVCETPDVRGEQIGGRIALFYGELPDARLLLDCQPAAVILVTPDKARAWHEIIGPDSALSGRLPMITLGFADGVDLVRHGVPRLHLDISTTIEDVTGHNVVATIPGSAGPGRRILVTGHYDSVPAGGAAADNATGAACALEMVRSLGQLDLDVTVDFVNFSAEEIGLYGAAAYARQHAEALTTTELGIYFDGQGDFLGRNNIHVMGQQGLVELVRTRCAESGYAADVHHHFTGLDQVFLSAHGVPTLWFQRSPQLTWHTRADISQDVSPAAMRASIAAAVDIARHVDAHPGCFPAGIPDDQAGQIRDYVRSGAPSW